MAPPIEWPPQDHVLVAAGRDKSPDPFHIALHGAAWLSSRVAWKIYRLGISEVPELVIKGEAGVPGSVEEDQFH